MDYKVLLTTSGIGRRLGDLTRHTNKALVNVGQKPVISYIIDAYPVETRFVVTLGHFGDQVKEYLSLAYPDRRFEFVAVDTYTGSGSSLGYSLLHARHALQCPFVYHASDTIVTEKIPLPDHNWVGVFKGVDSAQYASWKVVNDHEIKLGDKGASDFDFLHIGLVGVNDYELFWDSLEKKHKENSHDETLGDCQVIVAMQTAGVQFQLHEFLEWHDLGNIAALQHARSYVINQSVRSWPVLAGQNFLVKDAAKTILSEIDMVLSKLKENEVVEFTKKIMSAKKIVAVGAGRVGMATRGFVMRLGHLGLSAYMIGDATVPSIHEGDVLLVCSGSGETTTIYDLVEIGRRNKATIVLITGNTNSRMAWLAHHIVEIPAPSKVKAVGSFVSVQPMTTLNEQCLAIFFDAVVLYLMEQMQETHETMWARHSNLE